VNLGCSVAIAAGALEVGRRAKAHVLLER